jgi:hypothetical protein
MWPEDRDRIQSAIDDVARQMTDGAPGSAFKAHVLARMSERRTRWFSPWVIVPVTAAALILLATALQHQRAIVPDSRAVARLSTGGQAGGGKIPAARSHPPTDNRASTEPHQRPEPSLREAVTSRSTATANGHTLRPIGTLPSTDAFASAAAGELAVPTLEVETIAVDRLARPEPLTLQHLEILPIELVPIGEGEHR